MAGRGSGWLVVFCTKAVINVIICSMHVLLSDGRDMESLRQSREIYDDVSALERALRKEACDGEERDEPVDGG